jgi:hypothetical protein
MRSANEKNMILVGRDHSEVRMDVHFFAQHERKEKEPIICSNDGGVTQCGGQDTNCQQSDIELLAMNALLRS